MATATIERPGVQVIQEFRTSTPTILTPTLPPCVLGPCFQVVEAVQNDGTLNASSKLRLPARISFKWQATTYSVATEDLVLSVNNAAPATVPFLAGSSPMTAAEVAAHINAELIAGLVAEVETITGYDRVVLRTLMTGDNASIEISTGTGASLLASFGLLLGKRDSGRDGYNNALVLEPQFADYPDPRGNLAKLTVDYSTVRVFLNNGGGNISEVLHTESFLDGAFAAVQTVDDMDGDNLTPYLVFASGEFVARQARIVSTVKATTGRPAFAAGDLKIYVDSTLRSMTFVLAPVDVPALLAAINSTVTGLGTWLTATVDANGYLVLTAILGDDLQVSSASTIVLATVGLPAYTHGASKPSRARVQGTTDLTAGPFDATTVWGRALRMSVDGGVWQTLKFGAPATAAAIVAAINALWGPVVASVWPDDNRLVLKSNTETLLGQQILGRESTIQIDTAASDATLLAYLGLTGVTLVEGNAYAVAAGDEVWADSRLLGTVVEIPAGSTDTLRLSAEQLLTYAATSWTIKAKTLSNETWTDTRPSTNLVIDAESGTVRIKSGLYRDSGGVPVTAGPLNTYLAYTALRKDVTSAYDEFNLLRIGSVTDLQDQLSPIDTQNPLGLGMYAAILNAPGMEVTGCGVDAATTTEPGGTLDAYTRGFQFLESKDVYAIAPLTHALDVGTIAQIHVDEMSSPANGLERIVILNPSRPTRQSSTLLASGPLGNVAGTIAVPTSDVSTAIANLQALMAAAGYPGPSYVLADNVYLEFESDSNRYLVSSVSGGYVTLNPGPFVTGNTDGFYFDNLGVDIFDSVIVDRPFTVQVRGAALTNRTEEASAYADIARTYLDRRVICTAPDQARMTIDGLDTLVEGYYLNAGLAGKIAAKLPQQPLTEDTVGGFTGVVGSQDRYSEAQLQILSGGGLWVFYQQSTSAPVRTRHQLTTDMSSVEKRELSVTTALDFAAKMIRASLRNFIGRYNITTTVSDALTVVMEGIRTYLLRLGVFKSFAVAEARQSASQPDALEIDVVVGVLYPLNYIRVTLIV